MTKATQLARVEIESIYAGANAAIWQSHELASRIARTSAREEDYVATLVTDAVPILADRWSSVLRPRSIRLRVSGVFCHGHPQVRFGAASHRVELADLLIVHQHQDKRARATARAVLVQAKISANSTCRLPPGDPQLDLYSTWPKFEFVSGGLKPGLRDLNEVGRGSRYALVLAENQFPEYIEWADQCPWATCPAGQVLAAERSLARLLGNILLGRDGRQVGLSFPKGDWSRTIKELLEVTGKRTYTRTNIGRGSVARGSSGGARPSDVLHFAASETDHSGGHRSPFGDLHANFFGRACDSPSDAPSYRPPGESVDEPEGGISTLIIETQDLDADLRG